MNFLYSLKKYINRLYCGTFYSLHAVYFDEVSEKTANQYDFELLNISVLPESDQWLLKCQFFWWRTSKPEGTQYELAPITRTMTWALWTLRLRSMASESPGRLKKKKTHILKKCIWQRAWAVEGWGVGRAGKEREREADSPLSREPDDMGLDPRTLGSWPEPKTDA